jgi:hypothetical protein
MPKLLKKAGPVGIAVTAYELWKKLPPKQKRAVAQQVRKHGPKVAKAAVKAVRKSRGRGA